MDEPKIDYVTIRVTDNEDWQDIECRFMDGQKFVAVQVDKDFPILANQIADALNATRREDALVERLAEAEKVIDALYDKSSVVYLDDDGVDRTRGNKLAIMYRLARNYKALAADDKAKGDL